MRYFLFFLIATLSYNSFGQMTAEEVIEKVKAKYLSLDTYSDEGVCHTIFYDKSGREKSYTTKPFSTVFIKGNKFRFEYHVVGKPNSEYIIFQDTDKSVSTYWGLFDRYENPETLSLALAAAAGVSSGTSSNIPGLLFSKGNVFGGVKDSLEVRIEKIKGKKYYVLSGERSSNVEKVGYVTTKEEIYIDFRKFVISKIKSKGFFENFNTSKETTYDYKLNKKIKSKDVVFK